MSALGIIFSNSHNESIDELTRKRSTASIPFGGRYRLIDFALSDLVNADIFNVGVLAQKNYQSLMDHVGSGKDWDLSRKNGGLRIFPPFGYYKSDFFYENRLEGLKSIMGFISKSKEDNVVLMDCDSVNNVDFNEVLEQHEKNEADITIVYRNGLVSSDFANHMTLKINEEQLVTGATLKAKLGTTDNISINMWVINRRLLQGLLNDAIVSGYTSFQKDIIFANVKKLKICGYHYTGIYMHLNSMQNYFISNMYLLREDVREGLFGDPEKRIYTKVRDSAPTRFGTEAIVQNSFIADGCEIEGTVINSVIFRGVKIGKDTVVKNTILMQDTIIGSNVKLDYVITDKNVSITDKNNLSGCEKIPYYLGKNQLV